MAADRPTVLTISITEMSWITRIKTSNKIVDVNANRRAAYYADTHPKWLAPLIANECAKRIIFIVNFDNVVFTDESQFHFYRCTQKTIDQNFVDLSKNVTRSSSAVTIGRISKFGLTLPVFVTGNISTIKYCEEGFAVV